jgi:hypothetical protein
MKKLHQTLSFVSLNDGFTHFRREFGKLFKFAKLTLSLIVSMPFPADAKAWRASIDAVTSIASQWPALADIDLIAQTWKRSAAFLIRGPSDQEVMGACIGPTRGQFCSARFDYQHDPREVSAK